jgi:hypothetical protein
MADDATTRLCAEVNNRRRSLIFNIPPTRYTPLNPYASGYTQAQLDMRRKAEVLQYNKTSNGRMTNKQRWVNVVNGNTQRRTYSSYVLRAIADGEADPCPNDLALPTLTTASDVPGPPMYLYYDSTIPLYNYNSQQISYGTQNNEETTNWILTNNIDILGNNSKILTMNIRPSVDQYAYSFSVTTSVALRVTCTNNGIPSGGDISGVFSINIPTENISLNITYGEKPVLLATPPKVVFESGFLQDVSGKVFTKAAGTYTGTIYMGNVTFTGILLNTVPGYTYDFAVQYIPSYTKNNIDTVNVSLISNIKNTQLLQQSGLIFLTSVSPSPVKTLTLVGV